MSVATVLVMVLAAFAAMPGVAVNEKEERYLVKFMDKVDEDLIKKNNGKVVKKLGYTSAIVSKMKASDAKALKKNDKVEAVEIDHKAMALGKLTPQAKGGKPGKPDKPGDEEPPLQPPESEPWGIGEIYADTVWESSTGSTVKVAVMDTGIDTDHPDLVVKGGINVINTRKSYNDDNGHGTHCAGTIAAVDNEIGVIGVSHQVDLYAIKALNRRGSGYFSDFIDGLYWAINNDIDVVSMSFGGTYYSSLFDDAITDAYDAGIVLVAAAGNNGASVLYPAKFTEVIAVAATTESGTVALFSNPGSEIDVAAPGEGVLSTYKGGTYAYGSGTSMACPHVAGTIALILEDHGSEDQSQVKTRLTATAHDITGTDKDGSGLIDAYLAYNYVAP
jgi:subtilisin family serine protease